MNGGTLTGLISGLVILITALTTAVVTVLKSIRENRVAIVAELEKAQEVASQTHVAVNNNYRELSEKYNQGLLENKILTEQVLQLSKNLSILIERLNPGEAVVPPPGQPLP